MRTTDVLVAAAYLIVIGGTTPAIAQCVGPIFDTDCAGECSVTSCSCTFPDHYWSATTAPDNPNQAWMVHFEDGSVVAVPKTAGVGYVRAVRDGF